jgi:hypothetical protein
MSGQVDDPARVAVHDARDRRSARIAGIVGIVIGALMVIGGVAAWFGISSELAQEKITVSEDAAFMQGAPVVDPLTAWAQAEVIQQHALDATGGKTYAELDQDDPLRDVAASSSYLRTSLFTSIVAFGVALLAAGTGVIAILYGWSLVTLGRRPV